VEQTAAQKAGYHGETKESGSDPRRGKKQWDPAWERRMRKLLGDKVGDAGDLYDPKHRQWLNKQARKQKGAKGEVAPTGEEAPPEEAVTPEEEATTGLPVAQGSADQLRGLEDGGPKFDMPGRRVPGDGGGDQPLPMGPEEQERLRGMQDPTEQMQTGLWTDEDQRRQDEATRRPGAGGPEDQLQTGLWTPEDEARSRAADQGQALEGDIRQEPYLTGAGVAPPDYPKASGGTKYAQVATPWPPPPIQPTYYTGGM
jgi:hypothetical protein